MQGGDKGGQASSFRRPRSTSRSVTSASILRVNQGTSANKVKGTANQWEDGSIYSSSIRDGTGKIKLAGQEGASQRNMNSAGKPKPSKKSRKGGAAATTTPGVTFNITNNGSVPGAQPVGSTFEQGS